MSFAFWWNGSYLVSTMLYVRHIIMLYQNSHTLETSYFAARPGDYAYCVLIVMGILDVFSVFLGWYSTF